MDCLSFLSPMVPLWETSTTTSNSKVDYPFRVVPRDGAGDAFDTSHLTLFSTQSHRPASAKSKWAINVQEEFERNFEEFLGFPPALLKLRELNMVVSGGSVVACLLPLPPGVKTKSDRVAYLQEKYGDSAVDIFPLQLKLTPKMERETSIPNQIARIRRLVDNIAAATPGGEVLVWVQAHSMTIVPPPPRRRVIVHFGNWGTPAEVAWGNDIDCCGVLYDGQRSVAMSHRAHFAWTRRCNVVDLSLWGVWGTPLYEERLFK